MIRQKNMVRFLKTYVKILLVLTQLVGQLIRIMIWVWQQLMLWQALRMGRRKFRAQLMVLVNALEMLT